MRRILTVVFLSMALIYGRTTPGKAALQSLLVPGWGQHSLGLKGQSQGFLLSEAGLWIVTGILQQHAASSRRYMWQLAVDHAGVTNPADKDDAFFDEVGLYQSLAAYNDQMLRDRNFTALYQAERGFGWNWDSSTEQARFIEQKKAFYQARKWVQGAAWGIFLNHFTSALSAWLWARHHRLPVKVHWGSYPHGLILTLNWGM